MEDVFLNLLKRASESEAYISVRTRSGAYVRLARVGGIHKDWLFLYREDPTIPGIADDHWIRLDDITYVSDGTATARLSTQTTGEQQ